MATYTSGSIHFDGLGSNLDVDSLITSLYKIEQTTATRLASWRDDWVTRLEAFQQIRSELLNLQTTLNSINTVDKFLVKNASSSNESVAAVKVDSEATEGVYTLQVNQLATNSIWSIDTGVTSRTQVINNTGSEGEFTYSYKGKSYTVKVPNGTSLEGLKNIINNDGQNPGVKVQLIDSSDGIIFQFRGMDTGQDATLNITSVTNVDCLKVETADTWTASGTNSLTSVGTYASAATVLNGTETNKTFSFSVNGESTTVKLAAGGTLQDLADAVNAKTGDTGVTASVVSDVVNGETVYRLQLDAANSTDELSIGEGSLSGFSGMTEATNWRVQKGQNAEIRVDGWPETGWLERGSNSVNDVVDGVTFNIRDTGDCTVTVEIDNAAIEENVQKFVDAVNSFRVLIQSLTSVEEDKTTYDPEYAENQYEMQIGSVLTGNYGVQLLSSQLKSIIASQGLGFTYYSNKNGVETGDIFSTLSQIGIMTNSNEGSTTYGQLLINSTNSDGSTTFGNGAMTLSEALEKDPQGVAQLFAASSTGVSDSPYFSHNSHVQGITSPGTYDVSYSTDASGNIVSAYINGKEAEIDPDTRQISIYSHFGKPNAADGIVLDVYDLSPGQTFTGSVSIKQGKINEILGKLDGTDGWLGENGPLRVLEKNYQTVIQNIEEKIMKEDARLEKWERNMRTRFANLEATLTKYNQINEDLKSQIASLNSTSSS